MKTSTEIASIAKIVGEEKAIEYVAKAGFDHWDFSMFEMARRDRATGGVLPSVLIIALPLGLITDGILHSNNTRDMATDARAGIKTMAMSLGTKSSAILYGFEMLFPFVWVGVCSIAGFMPIATVIVFMTLPVAIACAQTMKNSVEGGVQMIADLDVRTANLQLMFSLLLTVAFVVARFL